MERLLRRRSGSVARFSCRQRHYRFRCSAPYRSTRIQLDDNAVRPLISCVRARRDLLRASPARSAQRDLLHTTLWPKSSVHVFFRRLCAFVALVPHYLRAERLLRRSSGGVALLPFRQRHLGQYHFWCVVPCQSTRVVEGLAWDRTPAPPLGTLLARIKGPGLGVLSTGSPLSRGVSRCRSACPRYLHNSCFIRGGDLCCTYLPWGTNSRKCF